MPNCPNYSATSTRRRRGIRHRIDALHGEQQGAVLLLCLAALLMLLLMSWALLDGIFVVQDKGEVQASADVAAYSQASVQARSMNMMAFTNVAKRSMVGVYATYDAMFEAFDEWLILDLWPSKVWEEKCDVHDTFDTCTDPVWERNWELFTDERDGDRAAYHEAANYYVADLRALDTYQKYLMSMTPWWGWSEAVIRAQRNGATLATSFPPPESVGDSFPFEVGDLGSQVATEAGGAAGFLHSSSLVDRLPLEHADDRDFWEGMVQGGMEREVWGWENQINADHHQARSDFGAAETVVIDRGANEMMQRKLADIRDGVRPVYEDLARYAAPWRLQSDVTNEAEWLFKTSNLVMTYRHQAEYFDGMVDKYERIGEDLEVNQSDATAQTYRPTGYWGLARSEISYQAEDTPNLWRPAWTARMRPVSLPNEFREQGDDFPMIYRASIDYLMLSAHMHDDLEHETGEFFNDLVYFERAARAMGQSTVEGVAR